MTNILSTILGGPSVDTQALAEQAVRLHRQGRETEALAASLYAIGLPELVTASLEDYQALALRLAGDPALLAAVRQKLADNRFPEGNSLHCRFFTKRRRLLLRAR